MPGIKGYFARAGRVRTNSEIDRGTGRFFVDFTDDTKNPPGPTTANGLLLFPLDKGKRFIFHPIAMAQYALGAHDRYKETRNEKWREIFISHAEWFAGFPSGEDGSLVWKVPHPNVHYRLRTGWHSAMAQGHGISVLIRAYRMTGERKYLDSAVRAIPPFTREVGEVYGVRRTLPGGLWYEEYPTLPPSFVLNGFMFSLAGLLDLAQHLAAAGDLFEKGLRGLAFMLPRFDLGFWSRYDLFPGFDRPADPFYHALHSALLSVLTEEAEKSGFRVSPVLDEMSDRWRKYGASSRCRLRALEKIAESKLWYWLRYGRRERI